MIHIAASQKLRQYGQFMSFLKNGWVTLLRRFRNRLDFVTMNAIVPMTNARITADVGVSAIIARVKASPSMFPPAMKDLQFTENEEFKSLEK